MNDRTATPDYYLTVTVNTHSINGKLCFSWHLRIENAIYKMNSRECKKCAGTCFYLCLLTIDVFWLSISCVVCQIIFVRQLIEDNYWIYFLIAEATWGSRAQQLCSANWKEKKEP